jgi:hypothetical protein
MITGNYVFRPSCARLLPFKYLNNQIKSKIAEMYFGCMSRFFFVCAFDPKLGITLSLFEKKTVLKRVTTAAP